jgi:tRNA(Ile)-lysidine synthase
VWYNQFINNATEAQVWYGHGSHKPEAVGSNPIRCTKQYKAMKLQPIRTVEKGSYVALSGGVDSIAVAHHLHQAGKLRAALWFNHGDSASGHEYSIVHQFCRSNRLSLFIGDPTVVSVKPSTSRERHWSDLRNAWFKTFNGAVVTGHNLDDVVEYYLMTSFQGEGHYTNYRNGNVVRPYLTTAKSDLLEYAIEHNLEWWEDPTNKDVEFTYRNRIRHVILPEVLKINPGIYSTVRRRVIERTSELDK